MSTERRWVVPLRAPSGLGPEQVAALLRHGYPDLRPRGVTGRPDGEIVSAATRDGRPLVLRNRVCELDGVEIDGHEGSDLDPTGNMCIHCYAEMWPDSDDIEGAL